MYYAGSITPRELPVFKPILRDKGWEALLKQPDLQWITLVSFDDTWSALPCAGRLLPVKESEKQQLLLPLPRATYIGLWPVQNKTVRLPDDLAALLAKHKKAADFSSRSLPTEKNTEWVVTAKRAEIRTERIQGTLERLQKEWKIHATCKYQEPKLSLMLFIMYRYP